MIKSQILPESAAIAMMALLLSGGACPLPAEEDCTARIAHGSLVELRLKDHNVVPPDHQEPLWKLELIEPIGHATIEIDAASAPGRYRVISAEIPPPVGDASQNLRWTILDDQTSNTVAVFDTWTRRQGGSLLFHLAFQQFDGRYLLHRVWYPQIPLLPLGNQADDCLMTPATLYGEVVERAHQAVSRPTGPADDRLAAIVRTRYPSTSGSLQMQFYYGRQGGVLFMTPDPGRQIKELVFDRPAGHLRAAFGHYLSPRALQSPAAAIPYPVQVQWVEGDWYDAAQIYRRWSLSQPWAMLPGPLETNPDTPAWFKTLPSWAMLPPARTQREEKNRWPLLWVKAVGGPMGLHWYGWDTRPERSVRHYPKNFPPREDFATWLATYRQNGLYAALYTNVRLAEIGSPVWSAFESDVVRRRDGQVFGVESWGGEFAPGCLSQTNWQATIRQRNVDLLLVQGVDGVYQDQLGARAMLCYDPRHSHAPGDPAAWVNDCTRLYQEIRAQLSAAGKPRLLFSEYPGEDLIGLMDGALTISRQSSRPRVPLFAVVFHTHLAAVGAARDGPSLRETPELFLRHQMQPLVHGSQLGWLSSEIPELVEKHPDLVACFKAAVDLRRRFGTMLGYGKLLRPPVVRSATGAAASSFAADGPAILSGFFREPNEQGKALAVFCNWTGQVREAVAELDLEELARPVQATFVDGAQIGRFDQRTATVRLQLPPRSVAAILLDPTPNTR